MTDHDQPRDEREAPEDAAPPESIEATGERRLSRKAAWLAMGAVALALALIWIAPGIDQPHTDDAATLGFDAVGGAEVGEPARLDLTLKDMNGADVTLSSFQGKIVLLNFWATWCGPCRVEIPDLVKLQERYRDDLVVLGVMVQDKMDENVPEFAEQFAINYPLLDGNDRPDVEAAYGPFYGIPATIIIDRQGRVAKKHSGIGSFEQFEREIKALL
ncbi:MAG TPA: redoxin domain-containing protein [Vicinamibacterales bacterium]|nr:redoxin domain-containing protein [Vicinamibacterales bacterium]